MPVGAGWGGGFPTEGGTLVGALTIDTGTAPAFEIDSSATSGTLARINFDGATTQAGAYIGLDLNLTTNLTDNDTAITGLRIQTDSTAAAATAGEGALVINSDATLARVLDIDVANTAGTIAKIRYGAGATLTAALIGISLDLVTNVTANAQNVTGIQINIPASASINSPCLDLTQRNQSANLGFVYCHHDAAVTYNASCRGIFIDQNTNVTNAAQAVDGIDISQLLSSTGRTNLIQGSGNNAQTCDIGWWSENLTLSVAGATTNTTNTIPADSFILAVDAYITTTIAGVDSTAVQIGDATTAARFASLVALTAGTVDVGLTHLEAAINSATTGAIVRTATTVRVTLSGGADNTPTAGAVRITVRYITFGAATS